MPKDDVNISGIAIFFGILAVTLTLFYGAVTALWRGFERNASNADQQALREAPAISPSQSYFPFPREQPDPLIDLNTVRARDDAELTNYGWINKTTGVVRIPIDRAIDLLAQPQKGTP
jgi:hypothetical protein